jgi:hypothetical protein
VQAIELDLEHILDACQSTLYCRNRGPHAMHPRNRRHFSSSDYHALTYNSPDDARSLRNCSPGRAGTRVYHHLEGPPGTESIGGGASI